MVNTPASVDRALIVTDSATSPRARKMITFEAVPLATLPTHIMLAASAGGRRSARAIAQAANGVSGPCSAMPAAIGAGRVSTRPESATLGVGPMPNLTQANRVVRCAAGRSNPCGRAQASAAMPTAQTGNSRVRRDTGDGREAAEASKVSIGGECVDTA